MIKGRTTSILILALLMGGGAAWMADRWIKERLVPDDTTDRKTISIVSAALDIPFGQKIEPAHLRLIEWPDSTPLPSGVLKTIEEAQGKIANRQILEGELVLKSRIVEHVSGSTLSAIIEPNMRAITLRVNDVVGVAGFLLPGNRVDVLHSRKLKNRADISVILENLKVLAVDQTASPNKDKPVVVRAVTLEVAPKQAIKLFKATQEGSIQLVLRNPLDDSKIPQITQEKKPVTQKPVTQTKPKQSYNSGYSSVTVIRGTNVNVSKANN